MNIPNSERLESVYGESTKSAERFRALADNFKKIYGHNEAAFFTSPGRTEIIGNHTDHNGGMVIAGSIDLDTIGAAAKNDSSVIHITSEGYAQEIVVDITKLDSVSKVVSTQSLVAGMMEAAKKFGFETGGFDAYVSTNVIAAAGVSSSASFEMLVQSKGYRLVIVNTGKGHADLSDEYSGIPNEMKAAAKVIGVERLCETNLGALLANVDKIPNDRAVLRAIHFFEEDRRVGEMADAIAKDDTAKILRLIQESGTSSWELLQNCYSLQDCKEQKITLTLALTQLFLNKIGDGVCRVHGGGFAGVIACLVPIAETDNYVNYIAAYVGKDNVYPMNIRSVGAARI